MSLIRIITVCSALFYALAAVTHAYAESHEQKSKHARYHKISGKQLQKIEQDCQPGNFLGPIAPDHDALYLNCEGKVLRGRIDAKGYGVLTDDTGNSISVQPDTGGSSKIKL